jgi:hypothetical protein
MRSNRCRYFDPEEPLFYLGLDLGQIQDYTALAVVERVGDQAEYRVRYLKRFPLNTPYDVIIELVKQGVQNERIAPNLLVVDSTGVGNPVVDLLIRSGLRLVPIVIHGGMNVSGDGRYLRVPKRDLVGVLQVLLQAKRLKIAGGLPESKTLTEELLNFRVRISDAGHDSYGVWREGVHDDLVLAVSLACWVAERGILPFGLKRPRRSDPNRRLSTRNCSISTFSGRSQYMLNRLGQGL